MHLRFLNLWRAVGWLLVSFVVLFSLLPEPPGVIEFEQGDKFGHLVAYWSLMLWFGNIYWERSRQAFLAGAFLAMGVALEFLQGLSGYRTFQYMDMVSNGAGILVGWLLVRTRCGRFLWKLDSALERIIIFRAGP